MDVSCSGGTSERVQWARGKSGCVYDGKQRDTILHYNGLFSLLRFTTTVESRPGTA